MQPSPLPNSRTFSTLKKKNPSINSYSLFPDFPSPSQPLIYLLSLWTGLLSGPHISGIIQYLLFCTSFHIHLVASIGISFLYMDEYYSTLWTDHTWFIYSSLGCFHLLAIVNNAAKSRGVQVSLRVPAVSSSRYISRSEMATHPSVLVWRIPGMGEPGGCHLWGRTEWDTTEAT